MSSADPRREGETPEPTSDQPEAAAGSSEPVAEHPGRGSAEPDASGPTDKRTIGATAGEDGATRRVDAPRADALRAGAGSTDGDPRPPAPGSTDAPETAGPPPPATTSKDAPESGDPAPEAAAPQHLPAVGAPARPDRTDDPGDEVEHEPASDVPGTDDPPPERAGFFGISRSPAAILVGLLLGLLGFALAVQVRSNTSTSGLPAARQEDLVRILDDLSSREDRLRRQIAELEAARTRLSTTGDRSSTALEEARTRSTALGILAGTVAAQGPGIELTLTDPERRLAPEDLLDAVEELRAAGAEAIQVGGVRIGLDSAFTAGDRGIAVDGVQLAAPYTILAIGDPPTLATAMDIPGGVTDTVGRAGGQSAIIQRDRVVIQVLRVPRTPRYSQPVN